MNATAAPLHHDFFQPPLWVRPHGSSSSHSSPMVTTTPGRRLSITGREARMATSSAGGSCASASSCRQRPSRWRWRCAPHSTPLFWSRLAARIEKLDTFRRCLATVRSRIEAAPQGRDQERGEKARLGVSNRKFMERGRSTGAGIWAKPTAKARQPRSLSLLPSSSPANLPDP